MVPVVLRQAMRVVFKRIEDQRRRQQTREKRAAGPRGAIALAHPSGRDAERSEWKRAFCYALRKPENFLSAGYPVFPAPSVASSRFSIASTRPVGVSVW